MQPAVALGVALRRAGHRVRLASYAQFADLAHTYGLAFTPIAGDISAMLASEQGRAMLESRNPARLLGLIRSHLREAAEQSKHDILAACADADGLVSLGMFYYAARSVAERHGLAHITASLQPIFPTGDFSAPLLPAPPRSTPALNRLAHELADQLFYTILRPNLNELRRELSLEPAPRVPPAVRAIRAGEVALYAFSRLLVPTPADWPPSARITGFWFLDEPEDYTPPGALAAFLAAGDPPVYVGFGSMNTRDPERTAELVLRALELSGRRGVLLSGWGGMRAEDLPAGALMVDGVPHAWLFPRMAALVHHAGSGTTAAGLLAGVPTIPVPFFADQPFWARRIARLGVGPAPLPRRHMTVEALARAIDRTADPAIRRRAAAVGRIIAAEDGVGRAVATIAQQWETHHGA